MGGCLHTNQHIATRTHKLSEMASPESQGRTVFSRWKYRHYFDLIEVKGKNVHVECTLCPRAKTLSTFGVSNSNLMKHLSTAHSSTKLVAKNTVDTGNDDSRPGAVNVSSANKE